MYSCMCQTIFEGSPALAPTICALSPFVWRIAGRLAARICAQPMQVGGQRKRHRNESGCERDGTGARLAQAGERRRHREHDAVRTDCLKPIEQGSAAGKDHLQRPRRDAAGERL